MKNCLITLLLILSSVSYAQEFSLAFGKVKLSELTLQKFQNDTNAEALVVYDIGKSYFTITNTGYELNFERRTKIKIFSKAGFRWAQVEIPYYYEGDIFEKVRNIEAYSYNIENSTIQKDEINPKSIFDEKRNEYWRIKKFALPNVKEGTIIEVKYEITSPYLFNLRDWEFQQPIPVVYSQYTTKMNPFYEYIYIMQGKNKFDVYDTYEDDGLLNHFMGMSYRDIVYTFGMKDIPAFVDESFITSRNDYITKIDFQLSKIKYPDGYKKEILSTWPTLNNELLRATEFGKFCKNAEKSAKDLINLQEIAGKTKTEQLEYIVNFVKSSFSWNGYNRKYAQKTIKELKKEKTGNSAELNLLLVGLLNAAGIEAYPLLISTRQNGKIKNDYPFLHFFNYVIAIVNIDGKFILTDATEPLCPFNRIPSRCINETGLIVKKDGQDWVKLTNNELSVVEKNLQLSFNQTHDTLLCSVVNSFSNYEAYDYKTTYKNDNEKIKKSLLTLGYNTIDTLQTENYLETLKPYKTKYKATYSIESIENKLYIAPFLNEAITINPLKQATRIYPVDFIYPYGRKFRTVITIPDGYKTDFLPESLKINNSQISVEYQISSIDEKTILVIGIYSFKNAIYKPEEYSTLKFYFNEIIKKFNEKIVLTKI